MSVSEGGDQTSNRGRQHRFSAHRSCDDITSVKKVFRSNVFREAQRAEYARTLDISPHRTTRTARRCRGNVDSSVFEHTRLVSLTVSGRVVLVLAAFVCLFLVFLDIL